MAGKNSGADGSMTGGSGPIKGPYYPKGGAKGGTWTKGNDPWSTKNTQADKGKTGGGGAYEGSKGTVTRQSVWKVQKGADGPGDTGNGTNHSGANKPSSDKQPKRGNYDNWPSSDTTAYGSANKGKLK